MKTISIILLIVVIVEATLRPRLDKTREGDILLWYGRTTRKYIKLWM